ncbi:MAG: hypothetical protein ACRDT4_26420 [Micromonosporaceae bacterium]
MSRLRVELVLALARLALLGVAAVIATVYAYVWNETATAAAALGALMLAGQLALRPALYPRRGRETLWERLQLLPYHPTTRRLLATLTTTRGRHRAPQRSLRESLQQLVVGVRDD